MKKLWLGLIVFLILLSISGCSEKTKEQILNKTIHDFDGYEVQNLDESEDTNFVVYQKGVIQLDMSNGKNTPTKMDNDNFRYTFTNASAELKAMKEGDVFWGVLQSGYESLSIKVKEIQTEGDTVHVVGEQVNVDDLFVYADINMEIPASELYIDESSIGEGVTVELVPVDSIKQSTGFLPTHGDIQTSFLGKMKNEQDIISTSKKVHKDLALEINKRIVMGPADLSQTSVGLSCQGEIKGWIYGVTIEWGYEPEDDYFYGCILTDFAVETNLDFKGEGLLAGVRIPLVTAAAAPPVPVVVGKVTPYFVADAKGSIGGGFSTVNSGTSGFGAIAGKGVGGLDFFDISKLYEPQTTLHFTEMEATVSAGFDFRANLSVCLAAQVYGGAYVGAELKGKYDPMEHDLTEEPDSIHDCEVCIDGVLQALFKVYAGANVGLPKQSLYAAEVDIVEVIIAKKDFYISFGRKGIKEPEFGTGKCPHKRWRAEIKVLNEDGTVADSGTIFVDYADGRTEELEISSDESIVYLPDGDNLLKAKSKDQKGNANAAVNSAPINITINLKKIKDLFILYDYKKWPDIYADYDEGVQENLQWLPQYAEFFTDQYPDAILIPYEEMQQYNDSYESYGFTDLREKYGIDEGDIMIKLEADNRNYILLKGGVALDPYGNRSATNYQMHSKYPYRPSRLTCTIGIILTPEWDNEYYNAVSDKQKEQYKQEFDRRTSWEKLYEYSAFYDTEYTERIEELVLEYFNQEYYDTYITRIPVMVRDSICAKRYSDSFELLRTYNSWIDTEPTEAGSLWEGHEFWVDSVDSEPFHAYLAEGLVKYMDPAMDIVDMLMNGKWNEYAEELENLGTEDIVVSETP